MNIKRTLSLPIISLLLLTVNLAQNNTPAVVPSDPKELTGRYIYSSGYVGAEYKITGDGKYEYRTFSDCCSPVWSESGSYALNGSLLHFKITAKTLNNYNMLDPKEAAEAYKKLYEDADIQTIEIKTEYDMQIVRWGERIYLLEPDKLHLFVAAVNFGVEPRQGVINENYLTTEFFLRIGDADKAVVGKPALPEPWISYLHDFPIKAVITEIKSENRERIYKVNKGRGDGLKVGMLLVREGTEPGYRNLLLVTSVEEGSAKLKNPLESSLAFLAADYQVGNTLVTKITKNLR